MRGVFASTLTAVLLAGGFALAQGQAQNTQPVPVRVQPATAVDMVLFSAINAGKLVATTAANGRGQIDAKEFEGLGRLELQEEKCDDKTTRVLMVAADGKPEPPRPNCRRRRAGAFWWGRDEALNVRLEGASMSTTKKAGIIGGAAAAATTVAVIATSGGDDEPDNESIDPTKFNGTYQGTLPATTNSCSFSPNAQINGVLNVGSNGQGTWQKTHTNGGVTFNFTITMNVSNSGTGSFTGTTSQPIGSRTFSVTDQVSISGNTITITQTLSVTSGTPSCTVVYTGQLTRI